MSFGCEVQVDHTIPLRTPSQDSMNERARLQCRVLRAIAREAGSQHRRADLVGSICRAANDARFHEDAQPQLKWSDLGPTRRQPNAVGLCP